MKIETVFSELKQLVKAENVKFDEPLFDYTYTKMGGNADVFVTPSTYEEAQKVIKYSIQHEVPVTFLGNGSNVIIRDGGIRGIVLSLANLTDISLKESKIVAQSGARIIDASRFALEHDLTGLEFACGIPGTVGGAVYMNAGAYGGELTDVLDHAVVLTSGGELLKVDKEELGLEYRKSLVAEKGYLVLEATFNMEDGNHDKIKEKMDELTYLRESKQPLEYPSCGSVFKRPPGYFAGKLIQDSELQGVQIGGAQVSTKHAGFIVNVDNATASDYIAVIEHVQKTVKEKFGVELEREVRIIGEDPATARASESLSG
ncbi:UDP-N-acetylmuramate dehydrogenase [Pseudalkalibacillus caeni]|uniref:UDP-N-acetylenolpyruvoylglucosamine reductase n=1 Tax=Exobacillus caeni TaxID=2574798 RepID=A0A5R9F4K7_9BACL|nr:UDP-N-acetylmuramate dehydrogenase [Pseudalkalibacillus caeni]TLS35753.1 UDP-N-acetylmuramate dehydrogenase [Pseudalkalibacillus caeni]